jgi:hypothetical protein
MPVATIETVQDLYRILTLKRIISRRANDELLKIAGDRVLKSVNPTDEETLQFMNEEKGLLRKYANYPTLTEWEQMPHLRIGSKWGSTFGVTILVGELVLEIVKEVHSEFPTSVLQKMLFGILGELDSPSATYLIEPFEKMITINVERVDNREMTPEEKSQFVTRVLTHILESFMLVLEKYGLVEIDGGVAVVTTLGRRVLMHLRDAKEFVDILSKAHSRLQSSKTDLTLEN